LVGHENQLIGKMQKDLEKMDEIDEENQLIGNLGQKMQELEVEEKGEEENKSIEAHVQAIE